MTKFVLATWDQATGLRGIKDGNELHGFATLRSARLVGPRVAVLPLWDMPDGSTIQLTDAGKLAMELREALGPDRGLTRAGAKALLKGAPTRATKIRLMDDGLWKRSYALGVEDVWLTEDGLKVREILRKYKAEV